MGELCHPSCAFWIAKSQHSREFPTRDGSSSEDDTWEVQRQLMLDEFNELKRKCSDLKETLKQTQEESARQIQEASQEAKNSRKDEIEELHMKNSRLLRRAKEAEDREAKLREEVKILRCGQPWPSATASSSRTNPAPSSSRPHASARVINSDSSADDDAARPDRPQPAFHATRRPPTREPQKRVQWSDQDAKTLVRLIGEYGGRYSKIEKAWETDFPDRHPRDQGQIKDKARNLKIWILMQVPMAVSLCDRRLRYEHALIHAETGMICLCLLDLTKSTSMPTENNGSKMQVAILRGKRRIKTNVNAR